MNCLEFVIKFKIKHRKAKIKIENGLLIMIKKHGLSKSFIRYFRKIGFVETLMTIFIPHFYVIFNGIRFEACFNDSDESLKFVINKPEFLECNYHALDLDDYILGIMDDDDY
jgi:hypothetical protein